MNFRFGIAVTLVAFILLTGPASDAKTAAAGDANVVPVLAPFVSDGCSVPAKFAPKNFESCCTQHDYSYWVGGPIEDKNRADAALINCIRSRGANEFTAGAWQMMLSNFGAHRWGSKWKPRRENAPLSESEWAQVRKMSALAAFEIPKVRSVWALKGCPESVTVTMRNVSTVPESETLTCYPLINSDPQDDRKSFMVFSQSCEGGYFVYRTRSTKTNFTSDESLAGYGMCVDMMARSLMAGVQPARNVKVLEPIRQ